MEWGADKKGEVQISRGETQLHAVSIGDNAKVRMGEA